MVAHKIYFNKDKLKRSLSSKLNNLKKILEPIQT